MNRRLGIAKQISFDDVAERLPEVAQFEAHRVDCDLYICALGFEDRTTAISEKLSEVEFKSKTVVIGTYTTNIEDNDKNYAKLSECTQSFSKDIYSANADSPHAVSKAIFTAIGKLGANDVRVVFDISVASSRLILSVLQTLSNCDVEVDLTVYYAEPEDYFPQRSEYLTDSEACINTALDTSEHEALHECGVDAVFNNELFPGFSADTGGNFVIVIPSYRMERIGRCLEAIDNQVLTSGNKTTYWIFGQPYKNEYSWRVEFQERVAIKYMSNFVIDIEGVQPISSENKVRCSTLDYREIVRVLFDVIDSKVGKNVTIIPNGSKLQMIGLSLVLSCRSECLVKHAKPGKFNPEQYSREVGDMWQIELGNLTEVKGLLQQIGRLEFNPISLD